VFPVPVLPGVLREIQSHVSEPFWYIYCSYRAPAEAGAQGGGQQQQQQQQPSCEFKWARDRLFDQDIATMLYEGVVADEPIMATVMQVGAPAAAGINNVGGCGHAVG
jgi:hypothetical protein